MRTNNKIKNQETKTKKPDYVIIYTQNKEDKIIGAKNLHAFNEFMYSLGETKNELEIYIYTYKEAKKLNSEFVNKIEFILTEKNVENFTSKF